MEEKKTTRGIFIYFMQSCNFDHTLTLRNTQSIRRYTFDSAKCLHTMYLRREKQCLLAFKASHSHAI